MHKIQYWTETNVHFSSNLITIVAVVVVFSFILPSWNLTSFSLFLRNGCRLIYQKVQKKKVRMNKEISNCSHHLVCANARTLQVRDGRVSHFCEIVRCLYYMNVWRVCGSLTAQEARRKKRLAKRQMQNELIQVVFSNGVWSEQRNANMYSRVCYM